MFTILGITFHYYGFIIGIAIWVGLLLIEKKTIEAGVDNKTFWQMTGWGLLGGLLGARLYHVATDFYLYQHNLIGIFQVWKGGLSIIGAVIGAGLFIFAYLRLQKKHKIDWLTIADCAAFGLPFGQAIGRLGNYVNQELYGPPSDLPWAIYIDPAHRLKRYIGYTHFHPLFAYEMIFTILFGIELWLIDRRRRLHGKKEIGTGRYFFLYVMYYSVVRFILDFIRVDKVYIGTTPFGTNQVALAAIFLLAVMAFIFSLRKRAKPIEV